jgi:hypothetical protein
LGLVYLSDLPKNSKAVLNAKIDALKGEKSARNQSACFLLTTMKHARDKSGAASAPRFAKWRRLQAYPLAVFALALHSAGMLSAQDPTSAPTVILGEKPIPLRPSTTAESPEMFSRPSPSIDKGINPLIVQIVQEMPSGGTYRANSVALAALRRAVGQVDSLLVIHPPLAAPSFCSGGTYLVFLSALAHLNQEGHLPLDSASVAALLVQDHQGDGAGVWGRWNSNGPGTARLFYEADLGRNFTSFDEAEPGDFLKIFWNTEIGAREAGHSVVYLGRINRPQGEFVSYWSSNQPNGFGFAEVPRQRIKRALFSRFEHPEAIRRVTALPPRDAYLAAMLKRGSTQEEMFRMVGVTADQSDLLPQKPLSALSPAITPAPTTGPAKTLSKKKGAASPPSSTPAADPPAKSSWLKKLFGG